MSTDASRDNGAPKAIDSLAERLRRDDAALHDYRAGRPPGEICRAYNINPKNLCRIVRAAARRQALPAPAPLRGRGGRHAGTSKPVYDPEAIALWIQGTISAQEAADRCHCTRGGFYAYARRQGLRRIPPASIAATKAQQCLILVRDHGLPTEEVARIVGLSPASIRQYVFMARRLHRHHARHGYTESVAPPHEDAPHGS